MLPNNLDMLAVIVDERQRDLKKQIQAERFRDFPHESGPIRRAIGRFLVWSGQQIGGVGRAQPMAQQQAAAYHPALSTTST